MFKLVQKLSKNKLKGKSTSRLYEQNVQNKQRNTHAELCESLTPNHWNLNKKILALFCLVKKVKSTKNKRQSNVEGGEGVRKANLETINREEATENTFFQASSKNNHIVFFIHVSVCLSVCLSVRVIIDQIGFKEGKKRGR